MKITYVANHQGRGNDDEGAICSALEHFGNKVVRVNEGDFDGRVDDDTSFVLFHKYPDLGVMSRVKVPKVCWYFDKIKFKNRDIWMRQCLDVADLVFVTDETYVRTHPHGKFKVLRQGFDDRKMKYKPKKRAFSSKIMFVGTPYSGREWLFNDLAIKFGKDFQVATNIWGELFQDVCHSVPVLVAPDYPSDDYYWSNRVYNILGNGGFLMHPYCEGLAKEYEDVKDLVFYRDQQELVRKIKYYLERPQRRAYISTNGKRKTRLKYSYKQRCKTFLNIVQNNIGKTELPLG